MAEIFKFFNSAPGDPRWHYASDFAEYFGEVLSSGLLHTDEIPGMQVYVEEGTLQTYVTQGNAVMQGYKYKNTSDLHLDHALPEQTLDRIDRIVLRLDKRNQSRFIKLFVIQGESSENPAPPELTRDEYIYELSLAQIRLRANTSTLEPLDLVDERLNEDLCGLVYSLISIPTSQFQEQWDLYFNSKKDVLDAETLNYQQEVASKLIQAQDDLEQYQNDLSSKLTQFENDFNAWFDNIQDTGFASSQDLQDLEQQVGQVEIKVNEHQADETTDAHNATNISFVPPTEMTAINVQDAITEVFQSGNNVKVAMVDKLLAVDPSLPITYESTWEEILTATGQVSTGKKEASGKEIVKAGTTNTNTSIIEVHGLDFRPSTVNVYISEEDGGGWAWDDLVGLLKDKRIDNGFDGFLYYDNSSTLTQTVQFPIDHIYYPSGMYDDGFILRISSGHVPIGSLLTWEAYE